MNHRSLPVAVIGASSVGLAAAAQLNSSPRRFSSSCGTPSGVSTSMSKPAWQSTRSWPLALGWRRVHRSSWSHLARVEHVGQSNKRAAYAAKAEHALDEAIRGSRITQGGVAKRPSRAPMPSCSRRASRELSPPVHPGKRRRRRDRPRYRSCRTGAASPAETGATEAAPTPPSNQPRLETHTRQTDSMTGTSTRTPTTVARAAPEPGP